LIIFLQQLGSDTLETGRQKSKKYRQGNYQRERDKTTNYNLTYDCFMVLYMHANKQWRGLKCHNLNIVTFTYQYLGYHTARTASKSNGRNSGIIGRRNTDKATTKGKGIKRQTIIYKTLHRKLLVEQRKHHSRKLFYSLNDRNTEFVVDMGFFLDFKFTVGLLNLYCNNQ
jgi:hypothetical protein